MRHFCMNINKLKKTYFYKVLTSRKFIVRWSYFYIACLLSCISIPIMDGSVVSDHNFADMFINYEGGFVRRGLLGEMLLYLSKAGVSPVHAAIFLSLSAFTGTAAYMVRNFKRRGYEPCLLTVCFLLGGFVAYGFAFFRRDFIILYLLIFIASMWQRMNITTWIIIANILASAGILCYEPFVFFSIPLFILLAYVKTKNLFKSAACWLPAFSVFILCCIYSGGTDVFNAINTSTQDFLPSPGIMEFLTEDTKNVIMHHLYSNFLAVQHHVLPVILISAVSISAMIYYCINAVAVFTQNPADMHKRRFVLPVLLYILICLLPMFTLLSNDYSRTCTYAAICTFVMCFTLTDKEMAELFPDKIYLHADSIIAFTDKHIHPTKFKTVFIMLFIGIAPWTSSSHNFFTKSEVVTALRAIRELFKYIYSLTI